jgi:phage virion morphogenesis protein
MSGASVIVNARLSAFVKLGRNPAPLLDAMGALVESQTRQRITSTKTAPDGKKWAPWSEKYAVTRHGGHSLLRNEGDLLDAIQHLVSGDTSEVGANLEYAATHQYGDRKRGIPARPYLGRPR